MPWKNGWTNRILLSVSPSNVDMSLSGFPLWVPLSRADLLGSSGQDLRFALLDGTPLDYVWTGCTDDGWSGAFVRMPVIDMTAPTNLYAYFGNVNATDASNPSSVWADYAFVHHFDNYVSGVTDTDEAGGYAFPILWGSPTAVDSIVGSGLQFAADYDYVGAACADSMATELVNSGCGVSMILKNWTLSDGQTHVICRFRHPITGNNGFQISSVTSGTNTTLSLYSQSGGSGLNNAPTDGLAIPSGSSVHLGARIHIDGGVLHNVLCLDGVERGSSDVAATGQNLDLTGATNNYFRFGLGSLLYSLNGILDEVRVRKLATSTAWMKFEHANLMNPDAAITRGPIQWRHSPQPVGQTKVINQGFKPCYGV